MPHLPEEKGRKANKHIKENAGYILTHLDEMAMYEELEDEYGCSGMCQRGLFYFGLDLHNGPPEQTCFLKFKNSLHATAEAFAINSILCGVVALFIFFTHFGLYCRPFQDQDQVEVHEGQGPYKQAAQQ